MSVCIQNNVNSFYPARTKALTYPTLANLKFFRNIQECFSIVEEMLDLIPLHDTTKSTNNFKAKSKMVLDYERFNTCSSIVIARA